MQPIIWGTAGHIDHGKTALIKALTGTDTDRLQEEQERGVTIDIGFAFLTDAISLIDVPGHEKFIKNMVTGVATIDAGLLVVAADDGVMPQTREHLGIMQLLEVSAGCVAISKVDLVDDDWLDLVEETIREHITGTFLEHAPVIRTSAETGQGLDQLKAAILDLSEKLPRRPDRGIPRLPVDRVFSVKGFGTVVTGSVLSGTFRTGDTVEVTPERRLTKIRGIQTHGRTVETVGMSERAALNLSDIDKEEITRGVQLSAQGWLSVTDEFYAAIEMLDAADRPLEHNQRLRLHLGTTEILARCSILVNDEIPPGETGVVKFRLEEQTVVAYTDRFIIRFYSPMVTIGGGRVLYPKSLRSLPKPELTDILELLTSPELPAAVKAVIRIRKPRLLSIADLSKELFFSEDHLRTPVDTLTEEGLLAAYVVEGERKYIETDVMQSLEAQAVERLTQYHANHPREPGYPRSQLFQDLAAPDETTEVLLEQLLEGGKLAEEGPLIKLSSHEIQLTPEEQQTKTRIREFILDAGLCPPTFKDMQDGLSISENELGQYLKILQYEGEVERITSELYLHVDAKSVLKEKLHQYFTDKDALSVGDFKQLIDGSRKYAIPLLEFTDAEGWTTREGEVRKRKNL